MKPTVIDRIEAYLKRYIVFSDPAQSFPLALWIAMTHCWQQFDSLGYVCITSLTKGSGKSTLGHLIEFSSHEPHSITAMTPGAMFHLIEEVHPVILCDEAEPLNSESAGFLRAALNSGYARGAKIERIGDGGKIVAYDVYCPKVFILIGDVFDTLRDRSFIFRLTKIPEGKRGSVERFIRKKAMSEGHDLRDELKETMKEAEEKIEKLYRDAKELLYLPPRESEIWTPLFMLCMLLCPERSEELMRISVDMATAKTEESVNYRQNMDAEEKAKDDYYKAMLLRHIIEIAPKLAYQENGQTKPRKDKRGSRDKQPILALHPEAVLAELKKMPTGPWRKFKGDGLTRNQMADMLSALNCKTKPWRCPSAALLKQFGESKPVVRVYDLDALKTKAIEIGIEMEQGETK